MYNLPPPEGIAREIVEDLTAALAEFEAVAVAQAAAATPAGDERAASEALLERVGLHLVGQRLIH
jgi:type I restriction enzyme M protein